MGVTGIWGSQLVEFDVCRDGLYIGCVCHCQRDGCDVEKNIDHSNYYFYASRCSE